MRLLAALSRPASAAVELVAFSGARLKLDANGELPREITVAPWGRRETRKGAVVVDDFSAAQVPLNQAAQRFDTVALDFNHNTVPGHASYMAEKEPRLIAANAKVRVQPGKGIVFEIINFTPEGEAALKGGHFIDLSPTVVRDAQGRVIFVHSAALCRQGEIADDSLTLIPHDADSKLAGVMTALAAEAPITSSKPEKHLTIMKNALVKLLAALGVTLADDADEAAIATALEAAAAKAEELAKRPEAMNADYTALSAEVKMLREQISTFNAAEEQRQKDALVATASREGKVIPLSAETIKVTPFSVLEEMVKQLKPGAVPLSRSTTDKDATGKVEVFSAEDKAVFAAMGLSEDDYRQYVLDQKPAKA